MDVYVYVCMWYCYSRLPIPLECRSRRKRKPKEARYKSLQNWKDLSNLTPSATRDTFSSKAEPGGIEVNMLKSNDHLWLLGGLQSKTLVLVRVVFWWSFFLLARGFSSSGVNASIVSYPSPSGYAPLHHKTHATATIILSLKFHEIV